MSLRVDACRVEADACWEDLRNVFSVGATTHNVIPADDWIASRGGTNPVTSRGCYVGVPINVGLPGGSMTPLHTTCTRTHVVGDAEHCSA